MEIMEEVLRKRRVGGESRKERVRSESEEGRVMGE